MNASHESASADVRLREVTDADLPTFFVQQLDPEANYQAGFTSDDPTDREAFEAHWTKIRARPDVTLRTILCDRQVAGYIAGFKRDGDPEVSFWLGREFWGRGVATRALDLFLKVVPDRPLYARAAKDHRASIRVLTKCGFTLHAEERGFANARGQEIDEVVLKLS